ncbi:MAG: 23S rRNA (pseudouridine(1915)-N(3))-methyltransferase RlmH [Thermoleophilaceae bacterium]|nr:23S rRNA (pseudouridine(1915)-N(3))-methyltransferase RlmH [Thermoleophilaceae bacterium]
MRISVIAVGRLRRPYQDDIEHYRKLIGGHARVELIEVREDEKVAPRIPERAHVVLLDKDGDELDSVGFSEWLEQRRHEGRDLCFVIGGPRGLDIDADTRLSLGRMTLPHQLARVVLLEQLYRAHKILAREPYHY